MLAHGPGVGQTNRRILLLKKATEAPTPDFTAEHIGSERQTGSRDLRRIEKWKLVSEKEKELLTALRTFGDLEINSG